MNKQNRTLKEVRTQFPVITVIADAVTEHEAVLTLRVPTEHSHALFNAIDRINETVEQFEEDYELGNYDPCAFCSGDDCKHCDIADDMYDIEEFDDMDEQQVLDEIERQTYFDEPEDA